MKTLFAGICALVVIFMEAIAPQAAETQSCGTRMKITDERFAVKTDNSIMDDIICALAMREKLCAMEQLGFDQCAVVRDFETREEVRMSEAFFVISAAVNTPQSSGVLAFKSKEAAEGFAKAEGGARVFDYRGLLGAGLIK